MPSTVNGIGTHYYGSRNKSSRTGVCQACGAQSLLRSYDTRLWFVVLFIPVIPLGRKRIIDECGRCRRHWAADLSSFEMSKQLNVSGAMDRYREQPSPETALELHGCMLSYHQYDEADRFRKLALDEFPDSAVLHAGLAIHLGQVGRGGEAGPLFQKALDLRPDLPEARIGVARQRIGQQRLDEARELLKFLELPGAAQLYSLEPLETLAQAYQRCGRHAETVELCRQIVAELPDVAQVPNFRKFVGVSERALAATESILPKRKFSFRGKGQLSRWTRRLAIGTAVLAVVAVLMASLNLYWQRHRVVWAMNWSGKPIQVTIDGVSREVGAEEKITLPEGRHHVKVGRPVNQEYDIELSTPYTERWFRDPVWVLNVDGGVALLDETVYYAAKNPRPTEQRLVVGERLFFFPHVDYAFHAPPQSLQMDSKSGQISRKRLDRAQLPANQVFQYALSKCTLDAALRYGEARLRQNRDDFGLLQTYEAAVEATGRAEQARQFLRGGLDARPPAIAWHRAYQDLSRLDAKGSVLATEYDAMLAKEPRSAGLLYLRARIENDHRRADQLFRQACEADPKLGWPWMALAYDAAAAGDWPKAREMADKAFALKFDFPTFVRLRHDIRLATGDLAAMEAEYRGQIKAGPPEETFDPIVSLCEVLVAAGQPGEARQALAEWQHGLPAPWQTMDGVRHCQSMVAYMLGEFDAARQIEAGAAQPSPSSFRVQTLAAAGLPQEAVDDPTMKKLTEEPWNALALSLAFSLAGKTAEADAWREKACAGLAKTAGDARQTAACLRGPKPPTTAAVGELVISADYKALVAAALAARFADARPELLRQARLLNVTRLPPYHLVRQAVEKWDKSEPGPERRRLPMVAMTRQEFDLLVDRIERRYGPRPLALRLRIALLVALGYAAFLAWFLPVLLLSLLFFLGAVAVESQVGTVLLGAGCVLMIVGGMQAVGLLWVVIDRQPQRVVRRREAPRLFDLLDRLRTASRSARFHEVQITAEFNAGVELIPRLGFFGWPRRILTLGLPLLETLAPNEFEAVLAHEFAHLSRRHGRFGAWIYRLRRTWQRAFEEFSEPAASQTGRAAHRWLARFLDWYWPRFNAHAFVLSRTNEYAADEFSVEWSGRHHAASALWRIECQSHRLQDEIWPDFWKLATTDAEPPCDLVEWLVHALTLAPMPADACRWMEQTVRRLTDNVDTHPSYCDRLRAMGQPPPAFSASAYPLVARPSAASVVLGESLGAIRGDVDQLWQKQIRQAWRSRHGRTISLQHKLANLEQVPGNAEPSADLLWDKARGVLDLEGPAAAEPLLRRLLEVQPTHSAANLILGRILVEQGQAEGELYLLRVIEKEEDELIPDACHVLSQYFLSAGQSDRVQEVRQLLSRYQAAMAEAGRERSTVSASDRFLPHDLADDDLAALRAVLAGEPDLARACLARKELKHFPRQPLFVLCVRSRAPFWSFARGDRDTFLAAQLVRQVRLPGRVLVIAPHGAFRALGRKIIRLAEAEVYSVSIAGG